MKNVHYIYILRHPDVYYAVVHYNIHICVATPHIIIIKKRLSAFFFLSLSLFSLLHTRVVYHTPHIFIYYIFQTTIYMRVT
jgi:hypothetical protein